MDPNPPSPSPIPPTLPHLTLQQILSRIKTSHPYTIGICGIPGSGKSTIAQKLHEAIPQSVIIPMDGFHLYRKDLDEEGMRRRGAPFTFDLQGFREKVLGLKREKGVKEGEENENSGKNGKNESSEKNGANNENKPQLPINTPQFPLHFPSFDHSLKDPTPDAITITPSTRCVIIQGLYIFDRSLYLSHFWDMKIFITEPKSTCLPRLIRRCVQTGIEDTWEKAQERATESDLVNADYVLGNSDWEGVWGVRNGDWGEGNEDKEEGNWNMSGGDKIIKS